MSNKHRKLAAQHKKQLDKMAMYMVADHGSKKIPTVKAGHCYGVVDNQGDVFNKSLDIRG